MNTLNTFTSTGMKLFRHPELLSSWQQGHPIPHSLQVALTEKCNLHCEFCSVRNRDGRFEFDYDDLISATDGFIGLGTKTIEITGGGEPLCYPHFDRYVKFLKKVGMKIGLITNGISINDHPLPFEWIRISANVYDYLGKIDIPKFDGTLGFSYVLTEGISSIGTLREIKEIAIKNNIQYIRLVRDCLSENCIEDEHLEIAAEMVGSPVFFQKKEFKTPRNCYWGYFKPFLYPDGYVYPCSSIVLNPDAYKSFHESYRICHWTEIGNIWKFKPFSLTNTEKCSRCVFTKQNEILEYSLNIQQHEDFI